MRTGNLQYRKSGMSRGWDTLWVPIPVLVSVPESAPDDDIIEFPNSHPKLIYIIKNNLYTLNSINIIPAQSGEILISFSHVL